MNAISKFWHQYNAASARLERVERAYSLTVSQWQENVMEIIPDWQDETKRIVDNAYREYVNSLPCLCGADFGDHSHTDHFCPNPDFIAQGGQMFLPQRFREQRCEANVPDTSDGRQAHECGKEVIKGTVFCKEHGYEN